MQSPQRHPSALFGYCEQNATPRQRRLMESVRSPDRFIAGRTATPTKQSYVLSKAAAKLSPAEKQYRDDAADSDPFSPSPLRRVRNPERYTTLRGPAPLLRTNSVGTGSLVDDRHDAARARSVSDGAIWSVGGVMVTEGVPSTPNGRGGRVTSGTNAPHYIADFLRRVSPRETQAAHERRLALAMGIQQNAKMIDHSVPSSPLSPPGSPTCDSPIKSFWQDGEWKRNRPPSGSKLTPEKARKDLPMIPFRVLDAPALRDDYYCSLLAYSPTVQCLAMGLGPHVYLWSEPKSPANTDLPDSLSAPYRSHVTSLSFSSKEAGSAILAIGRVDGRVTLWSPLDHDPRFDSEQPSPVSCVAFRPNTVKRPSVRDPAVTVSVEELLVGDEAGNVYYYSIEWPNQDQRDLFDWHGSMTLLARLSCHTQQVCSIAWSPDGETFATGGNDNALLIHETRKILSRPSSASSTTAPQTNPTINVRSGAQAPNPTVAGQGPVTTITAGSEKHTFTLNAACKALSFAPWQPTLLAAGGGSNDRCIHFFHVASGAALATIDCHAQVTSLVWSERRREIAATFGFAQPEHPYRVAVFAWPSCVTLVGIPWWTEERALFGIAYPRGPGGGEGAGASGSSSPSGSSGGRRGRGRSGSAAGRSDKGKAAAHGHGRRTREEGCLVVATSNASIKFHEIWTERRGPRGGRAREMGVLGGSQILEGECSAEVERSSAIR